MNNHHSLGDNFPLYCLQLHTLMQFDHSHFPMHVIYLLHNLFSRSSSVSFICSLWCDPMFCAEKYFVLFLMVSCLISIWVLFLLACSHFSIPLLIIFVILGPLWKINRIILGNLLRCFLHILNLTFQINWIIYNGLIWIDLWRAPC